MSDAMIMRPYSNAPLVVRPVGVGDVAADYIAVALKPQLDQAKLEVLAEVKRQGDEAKRIAIIGGIVAGIAGVGIGVIIAKRIL